MEKVRSRFRSANSFKIRTTVGESMVYSRVRVIFIKEKSSKYRGWERDPRMRGTAIVPAHPARIVVFFFIYIYIFIIIIYIYILYL